MKHARTPRLATLALAVLVLLIAPGAKNGCGSKESSTTWHSPVQAVGTLLERSDGTVEAELVVISTIDGSHQFVSTAQEPALRVPDGTSVSLQMDSPAHYRADSKGNAALVYQAGAKYRFSFELNDEAMAGKSSGGHFVGVIVAPGGEVSANLIQPPQFAGDTAKVSWTPANRFAIITVSNRDSGQITYSSFDFSNPQFDGDKWARLTKGGKQELNVDTFPTPGNYTVEVCAVDKVSDFDTSLSADLGVLSGMLAGKCAPPIAVTVK